MDNFTIEADILRHEKMEWVYSTHLQMIFIRSDLVMKRNPLEKRGFRFIEISMSGNLSLTGSMLSFIIEIVSISLRYNGLGFQKSFQSECTVFPANA